MLSISRNFGIDLHGPAFDSAGQRLCFFDALKPQPRCCIQTAHSMMAIANHFVHIRKRLQARSQRAQRYEFRALDSAKLVLPGFAHVEENQFFSAVQPRFYIGRRDLQFIHLFSFPDWALFRESENCFEHVSSIHRLRQVYTSWSWELERYLP